MKALMMITVMFASLLLGLSALGGTIYLFVRLLRGGLSSEARRLQSEEARMIQDIYQGLLRMEERVEALETILLTPEEGRKAQRRSENDMEME